jgi:hypothetical protein
MEITVTLNLVDPAATEGQLTKLLSVVRDLRAATSPAPRSSVQTRSGAVSRLGANAQATYDVLLALCEQDGEATLEAASFMLDKPVSTLRAYMMNAGRTLSEKENPLDAKWDETRKCVVYTKK